jgi:hypothetical protein
VILEHFRIAIKIICTLIFILYMKVVPRVLYKLYFLNVSTNTFFNEEDGTQSQTKNIEVSKCIIVLVGLSCFQLV